MDSGEKSYKKLQDELSELQKAYDLLQLKCVQGMSVLKLAEEKARTSEDKFMKAFFTSPDSVNINRLSDGMYVSVNKGFVNMLGYADYEVIGKTSIELNIWADPDNRINLIDLLNKNGKAENFEAHFIHKEGRIVIGLMSATIIELEGVPHLLNITKDITNRKQTEEALSREQFFVKSLMDNIPDHVYFKDLESRFIRINKSHADSFGLSDPKDAIGKTDFDFFSEEHARAAFDDEQYIIETGETVTKVEKLTWENKPPKWSSSVKLPLRNHIGEIIGTFGISRDITEQKNTEEQFRLLAHALKGINECVSITDMDDRVLFLNQAFTKTYGFNENDLKEENISLIRSANNSAEISDKILPETLKGGWHGELINRKKDGSEFLVSLSTAVVKNPEGEPIALIGVASDITERKRIELENQIIYEITRGISTTSNLDELLKLIHHSLGKIVYADNCFVALHDQKTDMFGFPYFVDKFDTTPSPTLIGKSCTAYVFRTLKPLLLTEEIFNKLSDENEVELVGSQSPSWIGIPLQTPSKVIGVLVLQHYEKENVYSENDVRFLMSIGGQIALAIERKQAESALTESERNLNESQKIAGLGSYNLDFRTGIWTSSGILDSIFGIDELYDRSVKGWTDLIHPEWRKITHEYLEKEVIGDHKKFDKEYMIIRQSDNSVRWVHGQGELIFDANQKLCNLVGSIMDITARKLAEEEIRLKNELLLATNAEKDKFFSIIAHDLRGPMSAFVEVTRILAEDIQSMSLEEIREVISNMRDDSANIYSLLENLLEWSRLKRGVMEFNPVKLQLSSIIQGSMNIISASAAVKTIQIISDVADDVFINADKHMIETVIRNLISNAVKFTRTGGKVTVSALQLEGSAVEISITDSGIGMSHDLKSKLFQINEKTSRPGTAGEASTGLGLLLCKEFVEKHNGRIWVESEEGKGSVFTFNLP